MGERTRATHKPNRVSVSSRPEDENMELTNFAHGVGQNSYHLVWKPKYAKDVFKYPWLKINCEKFLREAALRYKIRIYELEVMPDHVHCFVEIPPTMSVSKALNLLKGYSAYKLFRRQKWLRTQFKCGHLWSPGKFFRSVGNVTAEAIKNYIAQSNREGLQQQSLKGYPAL